MAPGGVAQVAASGDDYWSSLGESHNSHRCFFFLSVWQKLNKILVILCVSRWF